MVVAKPQKVAQYLSLGLEMLKRGCATLKQLQVVLGGLVYLAMFRRPTLSSLNQVWVFMQRLKEVPPVVHLPLPAGVAREVCRFLALVPLCQMNFRAPVVGQVTCSDASSWGGGFCVSRGLSEYGVAAMNAPCRGDVPEREDLCQVLSVGLFDGLGALRVACDLVGLPMAGHISIEKEASARRVVESYFADTKFHDDVSTVTEAEVFGWSCEYQNVGLVVVGAGPPCQGVSGLNSDKRGALRDHRSVLFLEVPRIVALFRQFFPWAQVHFLGESVASMDTSDRSVMSEAFQETPWKCDSFGLTLCHRPRLYWVTWELCEVEGVSLVNSCDTGLLGIISFEASVDSKQFLKQGWEAPVNGLPTFTTPRPRWEPGRRPAGLHQCAEHELDRWRRDDHRYPPYQYRDAAGLWDKKGNWRLPSVEEKEALGFPIGYTKPCFPKQQQTGVAHSDERHKLLGNSWQVGVIAYLLNQLGSRLGLVDKLTAQELVQRLTPGHTGSFASLLFRPPLQVSPKVLRSDGQGLVRKISTMLSVKGEDILLQADSEMMVKHHRLRASLPASLWRWQEVVGWPWRGASDHINVLEMRAVYTTLKWLTKQRHLSGVRFVHLLDSLVVLHALSRGRTSSRKMRRTLIRIQSLLLRHDLHPLWSYVHTSQNPADRPSRRGLYVKKRWLKK